MATMRSFWLVAGFAVAFLTLAPGAATADNTTETFLLRMGPAPNQGAAPNGDRVLVTCATRGGDCGTFQVHSKKLPLPPAGEFVHTDAAGNILGAGTWQATHLLAYQSYGCGVVTFPDPDVVLPPNLCGGMLKLRVLLTPTGAGFSLPGLLTVFCIVGPNPPNSHDEPLGEGVTLSIPRVINFNHTAGGQNIYIMQ